MGGLFSCDVTIAVAKDRWTFTRDDKTVSLAPFVYILEDGRVVAVGEPEEALPPEAVRVGLFDGTPMPPSFSDRGPFLEAFMRYGLGLLRRRMDLLNPAVTVHGAQTLSNGYSQGILGSALEAAGARSVAFVVPE